MTGTAVFTRILVNKSQFLGCSRHDFYRRSCLKLNKDRKLSVLRTVPSTVITVVPANHTVTLQLLALLSQALHVAGTEMSHECHVTRNELSHECHETRNEMSHECHVTGGEMSHECHVQVTFYPSDRSRDISIL